VLFTVYGFFSLLCVGYYDVNLPAPPLIHSPRPTNTHPLTHTFYAPVACSCCLRRSAAALLAAAAAVSAPLARHLNRPSSVKTANEYDGKLEFLALLLATIFMCFISYSWPAGLGQRP
jgi:hypothetical protein